MNYKRIIPDAITCCNLLCGCMATFLATQGAFAWAFCLILLGAFFDFFDGMSARALGVMNKVGVELDSLADDITFGLAPSMLLCCYLRPLIGWLSVLVFLMAAFAALRLATFNVDERQATSFIGLATPANAIFWGGICSMPYALTAPFWMPWAILGMSFVSCYLMVSNIPFFSLKIHNFNWKDNSLQYSFLIGCVVIIGFCIFRAVQYEMWQFSLFAGTGCILWYVVINLLTLKHRQS